MLKEVDTGQLSNNFTSLSVEVHNDYTKVCEELKLCRNDDILNMKKEIISSIDLIWAEISR